VIRFLPIAILLLAVVPLSATEHTGSVRAADQIIPGATVTARQGGAKIVTYTDENGRYALDLTPGDWDIEVTMFGFTPQHAALTVTDRSSNRDWTLEMPREGEPAAKPATTPAPAAPDAKKPDAPAPATAAKPTAPATTAAATPKPSAPAAQTARGGRNGQGRGGQGQGRGHPDQGGAPHRQPPDVLDHGLGIPGLQPDLPVREQGLVQDPQCPTIVAQGQGLHGPQGNLLPPCSAGPAGGEGIIPPMLN